MEMSKYLYRRQFILGPHYKENLQNWKHEKVNDNYYLSVHPDLQISKVSWGNNFLIMLGYILDPYNTSFDNNQILNLILKDIKNIDEVFKKLERMCGRFVMIIKVDNDFRIFNDTTGMRQIFYYKDSHNHLWCASQPSIIAEHLNLDVEKEIYDELFKLSIFSKTTEYWYPGNSTIFKDIFHLTPNHYINLDQLNIVRYWPRKKIKNRSYNECLQNSVLLLENLIEAATNRFNLALGISAGYDSRLVLAAGKKVSDKIFYFTHIKEDSDVNMDDVSIPADLLARLNIQHHVIKIPDKMDSDFEKLSRTNVTTARTTKVFNTYALFEYFKNEKKEIVLSSGNISEIAKRNVRRLPRLPNFLINGFILSSVANMNGSRFAIKKFKDWFVSAKETLKFGIKIFDLFYWEQRMANWAAMTFSEMDINFENFSPFNCRELLENMISLPLKYRSQPDYIFHNELIRTMWPETLQLPINPERNSFKRIFNYFFFKSRIYDLLKYIYIICVRRFKI
jgi:hypothetical protein